MDKNKVISSFLLFAAACIWGVAFVAQSVGMEHIGPFTFNAARFLIGGIVLLPIIYVQKRREKKETGIKKRVSRQTYIGGICCGIAIFAGGSFQQLGIQYTTVGKAGFITALYIIIVPILGIFLKKRVGIIIWVSAVVAIIGFYLLCIKEGVSLGKGDFLVLICAVCFSLHILIIDYFSPKGDGVVISCIQFFVSAVISMIIALIAEKPALESIIDAYIPILYAGIMSCGVAYTLQIVAQKHIEPTIASLILSLESVVAVLAGWILLKQQMTPKEVLGCVLVFIAILLAQVNISNKSGKNSR